MDDQEKRALDLVNEVRAEIGLASLKDLSEHFLLSPLSEA